MSRNQLARNTLGVRPERLPGNSLGGAVLVERREALFTDREELVGMLDGARVFLRIARSLSRQHRISMDQAKDRLWAMMGPPPDLPATETWP